MRLTREQYNREVALNLPSEHAKQVKLFIWADHPMEQKLLPGLEYLYSVEWGSRTKATAAKVKAAGGKKGIWDVHHDTPMHGYSGLRIEMKHGKNKLTPEQIYWRKYWESIGFLCEVCYSHLDAKDIIIKYLTP